MPINLIEVYIDCDFKDNNFEIIVRDEAYLLREERKYNDITELMSHLFDFDENLRVTYGENFNIEITLTLDGTKVSRHNGFGPAIDALQRYLVFLTNYKTD